MNPAAEFGRYHQFLQSGGAGTAMTHRADGPVGPDGIESLPRSAGGDSGGDPQQSQAGRSPVLDGAQLEVLRRDGSEHDMAPGEGVFADGDETYDLIVMLAGE